jgi:general secretion pathway protein G
MNMRAASRAFTLVEILIVVVILGILASIVIPQFSSASQEAMKSTLRRDLQAINEQVEVYRVRNAGRLPTLDPTAPFGGGGGSAWGVLVSQNYLREPPFNPFTGGTTLGPGTTEADAGAAPRGHPVGWQWAVVGNRLDIWASGYNRATDRLSIEP